MSYARYAIYFVPSEGPLATFGATWLGWDVVAGRDVPQFDLAGLRDITVKPRKYGFHGTLPRYNNGTDDAANICGTVIKMLSTNITKHPLGDKYKV